MRKFLTTLFLLLLTLRSWAGETVTIVNPCFGYGYAVWYRDDGNGGWTTYAFSPDASSTSGDTTVYSFYNSVAIKLECQYNGVVYGIWGCAKDGSSSADFTVACNAISLVNPNAPYTPVATTTNFTMKLVNNLTVAQKAVWTYDGTVVQTEILQPGQSATWTTPTLTVDASGNVANFTLNGSVSDISSTIGATGTDASGSPIIAFGTGTGSSSSATVGSTGTTVTSSSSSSGGYVASSSPAGNTSTLSLNSSSPSAAPTNIISFVTSTGNPAQEPTLQAGIQLAHEDAQNALSGMSVLNTSINNQFATTTNLLGQIAYWESTNAGETWQMIHALTNLSVAGATGGTNIYNGSSNVWVQNWPTNYNQEITQQGISNFLAMIASNTVPRTNNYDTNTSELAQENRMWSLIPATATNAPAALAAAQAAEGDYGINQFLSELNPVLPSDSPGDVNMTMDFCGQTIDLNPVHMFPQVANACYICTKIICLLLFLVEISRMFWELVRAKAATSSGGVPDLEVIGGAEFFGSGGEIGGNLAGLILAVFIPFAFIFLFSTVMAYLFNNLGINIADAMNISAFSTSLGDGYNLLAAFFPVHLMFSLLCTRITLQFTMAKLFSIASNAARFLFGK